MAETFDPYHLWLGIPPKEQPANHYRLLGIDLFEGNPEVIENAADQRMVHLRSFQIGKQADFSQKLLNEVAAAKVCLLRPEKRTAYDEQLRRQFQAKAEADLGQRPEIDSQLALALEREAQQGRGCSKKAAQPGRGAILGTAGAVAALLVIALLWATAAHKTPVQPAQQSAATPPGGKGLAVRGGESGHKETAPQPPIANPGSQISNLKSQIPNLESKVENSKSAIPNPSIVPQAGEGAGVRTVPPLAKPSMSATEAADIQRQWAAHLGLPVVERNSIGMQLVFIPPGEFMMGSTPEEVAWALGEAKKIRESKVHLGGVRSESPRHRVEISRPFYLGVYVVTQGEYERVMGVNPSGFTAKQIDSLAFMPPLSGNEVHRRVEARNKSEGMDTSRHPVETVNWDEAVEFCRRLSSLPAERAARRVYRLPTEAEWEYACRAGTTSRWYCGDNAAEMADVAWFRNDAGGITHTVGQKRPNAWGLYDMSGNVYQWCADRFSGDYYRQSAPTDPTGPPAGPARIMRGGCWDDIPSFCRSAFRYPYSHTARSRPFGFRVVAER